MMTRARRSPNDPMKAIPFVISAVAGFAVCFGVASLTGRREAWDSPLYFSAGIPVMCLLVFIISYLSPEKPWRWTLGMAAGQSLAMAVAGGSLGLWPLALIAMTILSVPQLLCGFLAGKLAQRTKGEPG